MLIRVGVKGPGNRNLRLEKISPEVEDVAEFGGKHFEWFGNAPLEEYLTPWAVNTTFLNVRVTIEVERTGKDGNTVLSPSAASSLGRIHLVHLLHQPKEVAVIHITVWELRPTPLRMPEFSGYQSRRLLEHHTIFLMGKVRRLGKKPNQVPSEGQGAQPAEA